MSENQEKIEVTVDGITMHGTVPIPDGASRAATLEIVAQNRARLEKIAADIAEQIKAGLGEEFTFVGEFITPISISDFE